MIVFGKDRLNWVCFKDLPMNCHFITKPAKTLYKKEYWKGFVGFEGRFVTPLPDKKVFAQVQPICAVVAVRENK